MKNLSRKYKFINDMNIDFDDICEEFVFSISQEIYEPLLKNYPNYRDMINKKCDIMDIINKNHSAELEKLNMLNAETEHPINTAYFLLGVRIGINSLS